MIIKNNVYEIDITGTTHDGMGVGKVDGFTVFVEGAIIGESVKIKIIKVNKTYGVGKLMEVIIPSENRVSPFCPIFSKCGGCSMQHMSYEEQLKIKTQTVKDNLSRIGKVSDIVVHNTIGMDSPFNYRNKVQFPVSEIDGKPAIGFYAARSHRIIDTDSCLIQHSIGDRIRELIRDFIEKYKVSAYNEETHKGLLRHVMIRTGFKTGEIMVVLVINGNNFPLKDELIKILIKEIPYIKSIVLNINKAKTNVIMGEKCITIYGKDTIIDYIDAFKFEISALSFYQVNPVQTEVLYKKALEYADLTGKETVFDLYSGIGTISLFLSQKAKKVYGVEIVEPAVEDAIKNAKLNSIKNTEFVVGEAESVIPKLYEEGIHADVVVVDPPRKGCDEVLLNTLVKMQPKRIVYVSCNPSTLARDVYYLEQNGFKAVEAQPVDMFPWTGHVETVVGLRRKDL